MHVIVVLGLYCVQNALLHTDVHVHVGHLTSCPLVCMCRVCSSGLWFGGLLYRPFLSAFLKLDMHVFLHTFSTILYIHVYTYIIRHVHIYTYCTVHVHVHVYTCT